MRKKRIYLDYAARAPLTRQAAAAMRRAERVYGNPSSIHQEGVAAAALLFESRANVAAVLNCKPECVRFVSGGTEANNLALRGVVNAAVRAGRKISDLEIITTSIEHASILQTLEVFQSQGGKVTFVAPGSDGIVRPQDIAALITAKTILVSVALANSEIGTIQPIAAIAKALTATAARLSFLTPFFHVDAAQAPLWLSIRPDSLHVDLLSLDGGKFGGPSGSGALFVRRGVELSSIIYGGSQEFSSRAGTENVSAAAGFAAALTGASVSRIQVYDRVAALRDELFVLVKRNFPDAVINGSLTERLPNNVNVSLPGILSEFAVLALDSRGIAASAGSACSAGDGPSKVITAIAPNALWRADTALRFTFGPTSKKSDVRAVITALLDIVRFVRTKRP